MVILRNLSGSMPSEKSHRTASGTPSILPKPSCRDILRNLLHSNRRSQDPWLGSGWETANLTNYVYDGNLVLQMRENSTPVETFTRGSDLSGSLQGAGGIGGLLARTTGYSSGSWSTHDYYHADGNGNITYLELTNQTVAASYVYDPYGNVLSSSGTVAAANLYRFSSKELHEASGMYYYGYRFYIPEYQRWVNRDPLTEQGFEFARSSLHLAEFTLMRFEPEPVGAQLPSFARAGPNLYAFLYNDPIDKVDKDGLDVFPSFGLWRDFKLARCLGKVNKWGKACQASIPNCDKVDGDVWAYIECLDKRQKAIKQCMDAAQDMIQQCEKGCSPVPPVKFPWQDLFNK